MEKNVESVRNETAKVLGISLDKLDYINEDLLRKNEHAIPVDLNSGDALGRINGNRWGTFCHSISIVGNKIYFTCGIKSASSDYGCEWPGKQYYVEVSQVGPQEYVSNCPEISQSLWFLGNYKGGANDYGH